MSRALVIAAALAVAGCRDARIVELDAIRQEVCACKTFACGEEAMKRVPQPRAEDKPDHRAQKIAKAMIECLHKLHQADRPSTDPDAEAPEAEASGGAARQP